jgi:2-polyprenyl-3-methyl-5-hydroxy-6-metoxy-1,4-benzoquinol methylase
VEPAEDGRLRDDYSDWKGWTSSNFGHFSEAAARYFDWHLTRALPGHVPGLTLLELGFGNGSFLGWARERGHTATGIETNPLLVDRARAAGFTAEGNLDVLAASVRFDLIAGFDVLEHVEPAQMPALLGALAGRLRPGGAMLFRFPNAESPWGLQLQYGDWTHVGALGTSRMLQLALSVGLELAHSGEQLPWRALPRSRRAGALASLAARRGFEWALRKMYGFGRGVDFSPNQLVVLTAPRSRAPAG